MTKNLLKVELHCERDHEWIDQIVSNADRIDQLRMEGYVVDIRVIVDGTRRTVFTFNNVESTE